MKSQFFFYVLLVLMTKSSNSAVLPSIGATQPPCPSSCECSMQEVQCAEQGLSDVPTIKQGMELVVQFDVSDNNIELLSNNAFKQYPNLKTIDVSKNQITTIELGAFHGVDFIQGVDLSENIIMFILPDTFSENPNLEMVNLSGNPFTKLSINSPILNAPMITSLDLSFCQLTSLTPDMLKGMSKLESLDIKNNDITFFSNENLINLKSLVEIKLDNNGWTCDDCNTLYVLNVLALRNHNNARVQDQLTCLDDNGDSKTISVSKELQSCNINVDDTTTEIIVTERKPDVVGGPGIQQHSISVHTLLIASIILTVMSICTALLMILVLKRSSTQQNVSCTDQPQTKTKNLMLAFAEPDYKRGSLVPLLPLSTPDDCPSSQPEWIPAGAERDQTASLYHDFLMSRPNSEHFYEIIDCAKVNGL